MQAIILAAGMGRRLGELTQNNTKCMVKVNGITLIERMLHQLEEQHLSRIVIVVGYEGEKLINYIETLRIQTPVVYVNNPIYDKTNNIYSLSLASDYLCKEDTLLLESDLIFEDSVIETIMNDSRDTLALVDKYESWMDGTCVKISEEDSIEAFVPGRKFKFDEIKNYYKTVNIYKFSKHFSENYYVPFLEAYQKALGANEYYEQVLRVITMLDEPEIKAKRLEGQLWYEIDDIQDLDIATSMFAPNRPERVALVQARYGGYWRYPHLLDFCYPVNPYFPTQKLIDEIKASFEILLTHNPSCTYVNSLLAAKNFGVHEENISINNGVTELVRFFIRQTGGMMGFSSLLSMEYSKDIDQKICFESESNDFKYTADDLMTFFENKDISSLLVVNPDNLSGNYIPREDMLRIVKWAKARNICLVVDETFIDFADEINGSLIEQKILDENEHLHIIKSLSESYGVPGLCLGVFVSGNVNLIKQMKMDMVIGNINSFAEFYMQIEEKYQKDYYAALELLRAERRHFQEELMKISGIRVISSQADYIVLELTNGMTASNLTERILLEYDMLVMDLSDKINRGERYLRLTIRNREDNDRLITALRELIG